MKEINELKTFLKNKESFKRKFHFFDIKVHKEYGDDFFHELIKEQNWIVDSKKDLIFLFCFEFFQEYVVNQLISIEKIIEHAMNQPFSTFQKTEFLKQVISKLLEVEFMSKSLEFDDFTLPEEALKDSFLNKPIIFTNDSSGMSLVKDMSKFTQLLLNTDSSNLIKIIKNLTQDNILFQACDFLESNTNSLIDKLQSSNNKYITPTEVSRLRKKLSKGEDISKANRKGRPKNEKEDRKFIDIWECEEISFEEVVKYLKTENRNFDFNIFVKEEKNVLTWQKTPSKSNVKYIQGFLNCCYKHNLIDTNISSRVLKEIFFNTFNFNVNNKTFIKVEILEVDMDFIAPFNDMIIIPKKDNFLI